MLLRAAAVLPVLLFAALAADVPNAPANPEWNRPVAPFRIAANLFHVGASSVSAFLLTSPQGHILIDTGFRETAPQIEANLKTLGFQLKDVKIILTSHAHYDHAGAVAALQRGTRARFLANPAEVEAFRRGGRDDFAFANKVPFPPASPDSILTEYQPVTLGPLSLTPVFTPGHTKGCTTWTTTLYENNRSLRVVIACSLSAPGYQLLNNPKYPGILQDFEASFAKLRTLPCDIFLSSHSWDFRLHGPFPNPQDRTRFLDKAQAALQEQIATQRAAQ